MERVGITAVGSALAGAFLVAAAAMVAAWAGLAAYDVDAARLWSQEISTALRVGPAFADAAMSHVHAIAIAAAALALTGFASFHDAWRATREAGSLEGPRMQEFLFTLFSAALLLAMGAALAAWTAFASSEPGLAMGLASAAAHSVPAARRFAEYSMENLATVGAFAAFLMLCGWLELRSVRRPSTRPTPMPEPVIDSPPVAMMQEPVVAPIVAASVLESGLAEPAADAIVRLDTQGVMRIEEALGRLGVKRLSLRQKTALAALSSEQQEGLAKLVNWSAVNRKTSIAILALGSLWLLVALAKSLS